MSASRAAVPCACTSVRRVARVLTRAYDAAFAGAGINATQLAVMRAIGRHPGEPLVRAAQDLEMDRTSFYRALAPLERRRWLRLETGGDRRSRTARITSPGRRVLERVDPAWTSIQRDIIGRFGSERWATLVGELQALSDCAPHPQSVRPVSRA